MSATGEGYKTHTPRKVSNKYGDKFDTAFGREKAQVTYSYPNLEDLSPILFQNKI